METNFRVLAHTQSRVRHKKINYFPPFRPLLTISIFYRTPLINSANIATNFHFRRVESTFFTRHINIGPYSSRHRKQLTPFVYIFTIEYRKQILRTYKQVLENSATWCQLPTNTQLPNLGGAHAVFHYVMVPPSSFYPLRTPTKLTSTAASKTRSARREPTETTRKKDKIQKSLLTIVNHEDKYILNSPRFYFSSPTYPASPPSQYYHGKSCKIIYFGNKKSRKMNYRNPEITLMTPTAPKQIHPGSNKQGKKNMPKRTRNSSNEKVKPNATKFLHSSTETKNKTRSLLLTIKTNIAGTHKPNAIL